MKLAQAYDKICREYLSKCKEYGCDSCIASTYCIINNLRESRYPQEYCINNLKKYLKNLKY